MRPFQEYEVWQVSHALTLDVYKASAGFPADERYGLTSQLRRASASIPTNIAEGSARGDREFHQFLRIALGSAAEVEYLFILSCDLGYMNQQTFDDFNARLGSVKRMLVGFMKNLRRPA